MNTSQNIAGNTNILANALHAANIQQIEKESKPDPMIVLRRDLLNNKYIFLVDSHNRSTNTISFLDGKKGSKPVEAPIQFYHNTLPIESEDERKALVNFYTKETGAKTVHLRQRLVKSSVLERDEDGKGNTVDVDAYKQKLIAAITKAILEA